MDGVEVFTDSDAVKAHRKMLIELMLARHSRVPIIRELARRYGVDSTRFEELPSEDCILCGLCVRMCSDIVGANALTFAERGADRYVTTTFDDEESSTCILCGACAWVCPTGHIKIEDMTSRALAHSEISLGPPHAVSIPFMQAVPNKAVINKDDCIHFKTGACQICVQACEREAIDLEMPETVQEFDVGNVIVATGFKLYDPKSVHRYGYGKLDNVITGLEMEKMLNANSPTGGLIRKTDGTEPESIAIIHCVGSRDYNYQDYCSRVCCMYSLKFAHLVRDRAPDADIYEFYIDMRSFGKGYEKFYERIMSEDVKMIRGKVAEVTEVPEYPGEEGKLIVVAEDTLLGMTRRIPVDLVVLSSGLSAADGSERVAQLFNISRDKDGFFIEQHPKLAPVSTTTDGIFIAGTCQGPKDIPDSVAQGSAAASKVLSLISAGKVEVTAMTAFITKEWCSGCRVCNELCPYMAITYHEDGNYSEINEALCKGCGTCVAACPSAAITARNFTDDKIYAQIEGVLI
jgi:heterodisulfide reductase subunit A